jgi:alpha-ketoglutarate-dependent taurine dioxygenase
VIDMPAAARPAPMTARPCPFDLGDDATYRRWREWKLAHRAASAEALIVDVADLRALRPAEEAALRQRIGRNGVAIYRSPQFQADSSLPRALGAQLGLHRLDANWLADEDGISSIAVGGSAGGGPGEAARGDFIPYTDRAIGWHTDGYYHPQQRRILGMILHCVRSAARGGETSLLDLELVYIALRDRSPELIRALERHDAMTIPAREGGGGVEREAQSGPVFSLTAEGALHMRYTARTRSIRWREETITREAVARLAELTAGEGVLRLTLRPGMGIVGHNVLHARSAFADDPAAPRLLQRARYLDRVASAEESAWLGA